MQQEKKKVKEKVDEVYPIKNTLLKELRNEENKKYIQPECLTLTYKKIERIEEQGIPDIFASIPYVHLSHNKISTLKGIQQFKNLQGLSISHNLLQDWTELLNIENRSQIQFLRVRRNPLCKNPNYHSKLLEAFQNLEKLDDVRIDDKCHQIKYQTQHASQPYIMQLLKVMQIEFEKIEIKLQSLYPHLFDEQIPTSQKLSQMNQVQQSKANVASTNNILGDLAKQKTQSYSFINSNRASALNINQQNQSTNRSQLGQQVQGMNTSISVTHPFQVPSSLQTKNQIEDINFDFFDHLIAFLNNDPTLKLKKSAGSILLGGFLLRLWRMLGNYMLDSFYKNNMNIYDLQIDLFSRIMKKYRDRHDHTIEQFLQELCENDPKVDKQRLFSDLNYGYACFFHEIFKLSEPPVVEEYYFLKDHLGIIENIPNQQQDASMMKQQQTQKNQQSMNQMNNQQNNQQQSNNQHQESQQQHLQGIRPASQQYNQQTFASQMSQSIMEEYNKEQKKLNQSQNQFKNQQSDLSPKNMSYFVNKNEQVQQQIQNQAAANQMNTNIANQQAEFLMLQNYFPLFLLNQDYMEIIFECVVEKLVGILHGYEILMYGELEDDDEVFYKFQNVQKIFSIYNPQEEIYQSIQNIGKKQALNESRLANQSRTKSERSINNLKRRSSANQSAISNKNNLSQNQKSRLSNRQQDGNTSSYASQSKTNMSVRSQRQQTADSIGSRKTLQQQQKDRSSSIIDQLNNTLTRLTIKRGHANSFLQNRSALNINQNSTYQQLQQQQQQHNQSIRSQGNLIPDLSPINQLHNVYNTNLLNTSQNQTAHNMSREQLFHTAAQQVQQSNYQTLPLTDYSPLNQQGNISASQNYQSLNVYDQGLNSPYNIQQQHTQQSQEESPFTKALNQNSKVTIQNSKGYINTLNGSISPDELQQGQVGTSYFNQNSKDSIAPNHSFNNNQQQSFSRLNQSKSAGNVNNYLSHPYGHHIGQYDPKEYSSYKEFVLRQQLPWSQVDKYNKSLQKSQYFVTILKNIVQIHTIPQMKAFFLKLKLASDKKLSLLYNILQRRMKLNAFKFWHRQVRKGTKNLLFNLMVLQKFFNLLRKNVHAQKALAEKHSKLQIKYKVFFGLVKILRNKRKIKKGLRKIRRLVFKKAILPIFQKLTLYYLTLPRNHTVQEINYNRIHKKSKELFNQLSIHFKIEDDYKSFKQQQQQVILNSVKSQINEQSKKDLQIKDSFKIAQEQINILNHQSRVQPESGILISSSNNPKGILSQNKNLKSIQNDEDNKRTIKQPTLIKPSSTSLSTIPKDKTFKQSTSRSKLLNQSRK